MLFHLRIIYILLFVLSAISIAALWISLEAYTGLKLLQEVKWSKLPYIHGGNNSDDETQRSKRNNLEPPEMFQDVVFSGLSSSDKYDFSSASRIIFNFTCTDF